MKIKNDKKYNSIDIMKFIMAICVIAIHTLSYDNSIYTLIVRTAVPFYFMCTGFLLMKKLSVSDDKKSVIKDYLKKVINLYLIWSIIYLPITIYHFVTSSHSHSIIVSIMGVLKNYIFVGQQYYSWPLWYLLCTIYSMLLIYLFTYIFKFNKKTIFIISIILFLIGYFYNIMASNIDAYSGVVFEILKGIKFLIGSDGGRLFQGLMYINIGMLIYDKNYKTKLSIVVILFLIILAINIIFVNDLLKLPFNILIFYITLLINLPNSKMYLFLRRSGVVMYFTHMIFFFIYSLIVGFESNKGIPGFLITLSCSIIFSVIINAINKDNHIKFLNVIFN